MNKINVAEPHSTPTEKGFNSFLFECNWDTYEFNFSHFSIYSWCLHQGRIQNKKQLEPFLYTSPAIHINNPSKHKCAGNSHNFHCTHFCVENKSSFIISLRIISIRNLHDTIFWESFYFLCYGTKPDSHIEDILIYI